MIETSGTSDVREDEPLWRFLRLPAFLALLEANVSLPTVAKLREADPEEGNTYVNIGPDGAPSVNLSEIEQWLEKAATETERCEIRANVTADTSAQRTYVEIWNRELSRRRCVWCWHRDPENNQSRAMWHIYADRGVAIRSDLRSIKRSLKCTEPFNAIARQIEYVNPIVDWSHEFDWCPFFLKNKGYRFEQEVRIVFAVEAASAVHHFELEPRELIKEVVISPRLFPNEHSAVEKLIAARLSGVPVRSLDGFAGQIEFESAALATFRRNSNPFAFNSETPERLMRV